MLLEKVLTLRKMLMIIKIGDEESIKIFSPESFAVKMKIESFVMLRDVVEPH
jgi:hypothetical protein